ncbi:MAG: hypothetical protein MHMPM18_001758 [Marteilia pararefringens]
MSFYHDQLIDSSNTQYLYYVLGESYRVNQINDITCQKILGNVKVMEEFVWDAKQGKIVEKKAQLSFKQIVKNWFEIYFLFPTDLSSVLSEHTVLVGKVMKSINNIRLIRSKRCVVAFYERNLLTLCVVTVAKKGLEFLTDCVEKFEVDRRAIESRVEPGGSEELAVLYYLAEKVRSYCKGQWLDEIFQYKDNFPLIFVMDDNFDMVEIDKSIYTPLRHSNKYNILHPDLIGQDVKKLLSRIFISYENEKRIRLISLFPQDICDFVANVYVEKSHFMNEITRGKTLAYMKLDFCIRIIHFITLRGNVLVKVENFDEFGAKFRNQEEYNVLNRFLDDIDRIVALRLSGDQDLTCAKFAICPRFLSYHLAEFVKQNLPNLSQDSFDKICEIKFTDILDYVEHGNGDQLAKLLTLPANLPLAKLDRALRKFLDKRLNRMAYMIGMFLCTILEPDYKSLYLNDRNEQLLVEELRDDTIFVGIDSQLYCEQNFILKKIELFFHKIVDKIWKRFDNKLRHVRMVFKACSDGSITGGPLIFSIFDDDCKVI